jgi:hypothetical protein
VILLSPIGPGIYGARFVNKRVVFSNFWSLNTDQAKDFLSLICLIPDSNKYQYHH